MPTPPPGSRAGATLADAASGEALLRNAGLAVLGAALRAEDETAPNGWPAFWRGYALQFVDLTLARAAWLEAESRFQVAADELGLDLCACGLVQCTLLDNQSYAGLEARARRIEQLDRRGDAFGPLELLRFSARAILMAERREAIAEAPEVIERALAVLGAKVEQELALRVATVTLPLLGLALDRLRSEEFFRAGTRIATSGNVSAYSRALWHLFLADACFYDAAWSSRLQAALDEVEHLSSTQDLAPLAVRAHLLRAALALGKGENDTGGGHLDAAQPLLDPSHPQDYWDFHYYRSRHALQVGALDEAWEHAALTLRRMEDAGVSPARISPGIMQQGYVLVARGQLDEAVAAFDRASALSSGAQIAPCRAHASLTRALAEWRRGATESARAELAAGLAEARKFNLTHFFRALPGVAGELCGAALELEIESAFARKAIVARGLACPDIGLTAWPWPLRLRALGGFGIERDGIPLAFGRKTPKRLLDLLRLITALGGRHADAARLELQLWPDADGGEARDALKTLLHRARTLLGGDVLLLRNGQLGFDENLIWLDTWAFEFVCARIEALLAARAAATPTDRGELDRRRAQMLSLYRGHLFGDAELPTWALPQRDRLRARFVRTVEALGQHFDRGGQAEAAIALYRAALEQDNLAEELYQRLIACHLARGEHAQALNVYRRCRELLSIVLGVSPSVRTEALIARIGER